LKHLQEQGSAVDNASKRPDQPTILTSLSIGLEAEYETWMPL